MGLARAKARAPLSSRPSLSLSHMPAASRPRRAVFRSLSSHALFVVALSARRSHGRPFYFHHHHPLEDIIATPVVFSALMIAVICRRPIIVALPVVSLEEKAEAPTRAPFFSLPTALYLRRHSFLRHRLLVLT